MPGQESHSPVPTAASWEYEAWWGPRNRTFCWARLRPSLLPKLQEPSPLASRSTHACQYCSGSDSGTETMGCVGTCPGPPFLLPTLLLLPTHLYTHDSWLLKSEHKAVKAPAIKISASFYLATNCQLPFKEYQGRGLKKKKRKIPHTALTNITPYIKASGRNTGFHLALMKPAYPSLEVTELRVAQWSVQREGFWRWVAG